MVDNGRLTGNSEAARARRLNEIAGFVRKRAASGGIWKEKIDLTSSDAAKGWWRYRSVRVADDIDVVLENSGSGPLRIVIGFSGTMFGGTVPATFHPDSLRRYPQATDPDFLARTTVLAPGERLEIRRPSNGRAYSLTSNGRTETRAAVASEQIAIFAADGVDFLSSRD